MVQDGPGEHPERPASQYLSLSTVMLISQRQVARGSTPGPPGSQEAGSAQMPLLGSRTCALQGGREAGEGPSGPSFKEPSTIMTESALDPAKAPTPPSSHLSAQTWPLHQGPRWVPETPLTDPNLSSCPWLPCLWTQSHFRVPCLCLCQSLCLEHLSLDAALPAGSGPAQVWLSRETPTGQESLSPWSPRVTASKHQSPGQSLTHRTASSMGMDRWTGGQVDRWGGGWMGGCVGG